MIKEVVVYPASLSLKNPVEKRERVPSRCVALTDGRFASTLRKCHDLDKDCVDVDDTRKRPTVLAVVDPTNSTKRPNALGGQIHLL